MATNGLITWFIPGNGDPRVEVVEFGSAQSDFLPLLLIRFIHLEFFQLLLQTLNLLALLLVLSEIISPNSATISPILATLLQIL